MRSLLVYAPSWIGDAVMSLGGLRALAAACPGARVTVLARPWVRAIYDAVKTVDETMAYEPRGHDRGPSGFLRAARRIRERRFDACVVLPNAFRAAALVAAARVPERWGYATEGRSFLLTKTVPPAPRPFGRHQVHYYLDLVRGLGFESGVPDVSLSLRDETRASARALLASAGREPGRPLVGIHPGATNSRAKIWAPERYGGVGRRLARAEGAQIVVLGGPSDEALAARLAEALDEPPLMLAARTSLEELMGVLAELSLFLTNDSGPMHLAAALGVPTLAVFGPTDPAETGPFGTRSRVVREPVDCSPCLHRDCPIDHRCMTRVSVDRVAAEAVELYDSVEAISP